MSSDPNFVPPQPAVPSEIISPAGETLTAQPPAAEAGGENPAWNGWDVLALVAVAILGQIVVGVVAGIIAIFLPAYRGLSPDQLRRQLPQDPFLIVAVTLGTYAVLVPAMMLIIRRRSHRPFLEALGWNWPRRPWRYPLIGVAMFFVVSVLSKILPMPKSAPIDQLLQQAPRLMSFVAICLAPVVEELFFRGFLYPVLTRWRALFALAIAAVVFGIGALLFSLGRQNHDTFWWGLGTVLASGAVATLWLFSGASRRVATVISVLVTAFFFALIHSQQLAHAWAAVSLIFFVGVVLTTIRARTHSIAACIMTHMAYNGSLCLLLYLATDHFRHMERIQ